MVAFIELAVKIAAEANSTRTTGKGCGIVQIGRVCIQSDRTIASQSVDGDRASAIVNGVVTQANF